MFALYRLRAFQGLVLLLLAAIALQVSTGARFSDSSLSEQTHGLVFRTDTPDTALIPLRVESAALDTADPNTGGTDPQDRKTGLTPLGWAYAAPSVWDQAVLPSALDGPHRLRSLPRAPPAF